MNHVSLTGHLTADPEVRETVDGGRRVTLTVATTNDESDSIVERSPVSTTCDALVNFAEKHLRKGSTVHVEGSLHTRYWVDASNIERYSTEVIVRSKNGKIELLDEPLRRAISESRTGFSSTSP